MQIEAVITLVATAAQIASQMYTDGRKETTAEEDASLAAAQARGKVADDSFDAMTADADKQVAEAAKPAATPDQPVNGTSLNPYSAT